MEGDLLPGLPDVRMCRISIHALRVEGDIIIVRRRHYSKLISIHALRVEGDSMPDAFSLLKSTISIHALRVEGDRFDCL